MATRTAAPAYALVLLLLLSLSSVLLLEVSANEDGAADQQAGGGRDAEGNVIAIQSATGGWPVPTEKAERPKMKPKP
jgi:hypothetical protein